MSKTLLIALSVILVFVFFCPTIVWSQTAPVFTVIGTVVDFNGESVSNGLSVIVQNETTGAKIYGVTGNVSNIYLLPKGISVEKGQFAVVFPPVTSNRAASVDDKIVVQVPDLYGKGEFTYTVTESDIKFGRMEPRIPYYTFTLNLHKGINLISIPLAEATSVTHEGETVMIKKVSDLGKLLGDSWNLIMTADCNKFQSYNPGRNPGTDIEIDGYTGLIVIMKTEATLELTGKAWDVDEKNLLAGCSNMIGLPLKDDNLVRVSDLGEQLGNCWNIIMSCDAEGNFHSYTPGPIKANSNIVIDGDTGLIILTKKNESCFLSIIGAPWSDENRRSP